ncbi:MAG: CBS domain-containing protein [Bacillota bacterium]|nr:hypothetical protein [Bacillota bacterium]REJ36982.1 MAG: hypothetical protein DIU82_02460 [Bacillota bacterium]
MLAREIMTADAVAVAPDTSLADVASLMVAERVEGVPVTDGDGHLLGLITATDFLRLLLPNRVRFLDVDLYLGPRRLHQALLKEIAGIRAADIMTRAVYTVEPDAPLEKVIGLMGEHRVRHLPVVQEGRLVGIIHRMDVVRLFSRWMTGEERGP